MTLSTNSTDYSYLRNQISNNVWLGKEALNLHDLANDFFDATKESFVEIVTFGELIKLPFAQNIKNLVYEAVDLAYVVSSSSLIFLESAYSINKAFNSKRYSDLQGTGNSILQKTSLKSQEEYIYSSSVIVWNETLNLPAMDAAVTDAENELKALQMTGQHPDTMLRYWQDKAVTKLNAMKDDLTRQVENLTGDLRAKARRTLTRIKNILDSISGGKASKELQEMKARLTPLYTPTGEIYRPHPKRGKAKGAIAAGGAIAPLVPGIATVAGMVKILTDISSWLFTNILLRPILNFPAELLPVLTNTTTSIVLKFLNGNGVDACRYIAAGILRNFKALLPQVFSPTGMFAGAWTWVMAYMPYIIFAAVIIILAFRSKKKLAFSHLYLLAEESTGKYPGFSYMSVENPDSAEDELTRMKDDLLVLTGINYNKIYGVGLEIVDDKPKVQAGFDLKSTFTRIPQDTAQDIFKNFGTKYQTSIPMGAWRLV